MIKLKVMKKILNDRLNHLKSELKELTSPKLTKIINYDKEVNLNTRINEVKWLLNKINNEKS